MNLRSLLGGKSSSECRVSSWFGVFGWDGSGCSGLGVAGALEFDEGEMPRRASRISDSCMRIGRRFSSSPSVAQRTYSEPITAKPEPTIGAH